MKTMDMFNDPVLCRNCHTVMSFLDITVWPDHPDDITLAMKCTCGFIRLRGIQAKDLSGWKNRLKQSRKGEE